MRNHRFRLYQWLYRNLVGPGRQAVYESEHLDLSGIRPLERYPAGILFPIEKGVSGVDPSAAEEEGEAADDFTGIPAGKQDPDSGDESEAEPVILKRRYVAPSAAGFSFFIKGNEIRLQVLPWAVRYEPGGDREEKGRFAVKTWRRVPLDEAASPALGDIRPPESGNTHAVRIPVFEGLGEIFLLWRPHADGWLTTISLSNRQEMPQGIPPEHYHHLRNSLSFFEVHLDCIIFSGEVGIYPRIDPGLLDDEEQEMELQYKNRRIYAVGHGAAVDWEESGGSVRKIAVDFLPKTEVPQVSVGDDQFSSDVLMLDFLAAADSAKSGQTGTGSGICNALDVFVDEYDQWICEQERGALDLPEAERLVAKRICARMRTAAERMRSGIAVIREDPTAFLAFGIANRAMLRQMIRGDRISGSERSNYRWRSFQLAFLLTVIESVVNEKSAFRDTVDLIWFPTGGGKTEAYLGLIAFLIAWRRLTHPELGGGTAVLMRYTLRLLTQQQFHRACRLIFAMELIRKERPELGSEPVSIGMWVGEATSPNTFEAAARIVESAESGGSPDSLRKLVLDSCPWCGTVFQAADNYIAGAERFAFRCIDPSCDFGDPDGKGSALPCNVVDEALYESPPTLMIATIDKFARLAWEDRAGVFFGQNGARPPELVIQDELHLISGALGSIAGLYEAAVDATLRYRGVYPKYIASTATIRMAEEQVRRLYGRSVAVFPPPGISIDDSFFARSIPIDQKPGRLYVGYLAPDLPRNKSMAPLAAALLTAPDALFAGQEDAERLLDAWWTLVVYHGSLKGVGNSHNVFNIDVHDLLARYENEFQGKSGSGRENRFRRLGPRADRIAQLTSRSSAAENAATFRRLEKDFRDPACLDVVLATNMISVGLDVSRLALMIVNGQPLTTAEYIQASSRVGRAETPGLVITNYYRDQARSLSHYESFRPYHESFYRFVEPSSITPYTYQARTRALHAALVIAVRHGIERLSPNTAAGDFDPEAPDVQALLEIFGSRLAEAASTQASGSRFEGGLPVNRHLGMLVLQWQNEACRCRNDKRRLDYMAPDKNSTTDRLLYNHGDRITGLWATPQSMRNVEKTTYVKLL